MVTELTRRIVIREGSLLAAPLYEHLDAADAQTSQMLRGRLSEDKAPLAYAHVRRGLLRVGLASEELPGGWELRGNPRLGGQILLVHQDQGATLRVLSESRVTRNGVPHAGTTAARRAAWYQPLRPMFTGLNFDESDHLHMLLLMNLRGDIPAWRIVHPIEPGKYNGSVDCDLAVNLIRDTDSAAGRFEADDEDIDFFRADVNEETGDV